MQTPTSDTRTDDPEYWNGRYASGQTGWDMKEETAVFRGLRLRGEFPVPAVAGNRPARLFVPGCGYGHDALAFARAGYEVTAVDFAGEPLDVLRLNASHSNTDITILQADVFALPSDRFTGTFDVVLEYTCYCALPPERRAEYARVIAGSLVRCGWLVALLFPTDGRSGGPPFAIDPAEAQRLFADAGLDFVSSCVPGDSHPARAGREVLALFRKPL